MDIDLPDKESILSDPLILEGVTKSCFVDRAMDAAATILLCSSLTTAKGRLCIWWAGNLMKRPTIRKVVNAEALIDMGCLWKLNGPQLAKKIVSIKPKVVQRWMYLPAYPYSDVRHPRLWPPGWPD